MIKNIQEKFDSIITSFEKKGFILSDKLNIIADNYEKVLSTCLLKKAYYGKVAVFSSQQNFLLLGNKLKDSLRKVKVLTIDYTLSLNEEISIETFSKFFNLPDDIRAVIVLDSKLSCVADYFAEIKKVPVFDISCGLDIGEFLENAFFLKNNQNFDLVKVNPRKTIIVDQSLIEKLSVYNSYAFDYIMKNIVSIFDTRINAFYKNEQISAEVINLKSKAISETFSIMNILEKDREEKLIMNSLLVGLSNRVLSKDYILNDSVKNLALLYNGFSFENGNELLFAEKIIGLYGIMVNSNSKIYRINDYNDISTEISKVLNVNEENIIDNIFEKFNFLESNSIKYSDFLDKFGNEISLIAKSFSKVLITHLVLGGKDLKNNINEAKLISSVKLCGALNGLNGMALFISEGYINLI